MANTWARWRIRNPPCSPAMFRSGARMGAADIIRDVRVRPQSMRSILRRQARGIDRGKSQRAASALVVARHPDETGTAADAVDRQAVLHRAGKVADAVDQQ